MDWQRSRRVTLICGASGTGKTSFALRLLANEPVAHAFLYDPDGEFSARLGVPAALTAAQLDRSLGLGFTCFDPFTHFEGRPLEGVDFFAAWAWEVSSRLPGTKAFFLDEFQRYAPPTSIPRHLAKVLEAGRRVGLETIAVTNRPSQIHGSAWQQVTEVVAFQSPGPSAAEALRPHGFDPEEVSRLPQLHWIARSTVDQREARGVLQFG